jgi:N-acyl-D-amino-acid deacylase
MALDLLIHGGTVIDGTGAAGRQADIGVRDGRVVALGAMTDEAATTLEATGLIVVPGFIDIHSHSDYTLLVDPRAVSALA